MTPTEMEEGLKLLVEQVMEHHRAIEKLQEVIAGMNKVFVELQKELAKR